MRGEDVFGGVVELIGTEEAAAVHGGVVAADVGEELAVMGPAALVGAVDDERVFFAAFEVDRGDEIERDGFALLVFDGHGLRRDDSGGLEGDWDGFNDGGEGYARGAASPDGVWLGTGRADDEEAVAAG